MVNVLFYGGVLCFVIWATTPIWRMVADHVKAHFVSGYIEDLQKAQSELMAARYQRQTADDLLREAALKIEQYRTEIATLDGRNTYLESQIRRLRGLSGAGASGAARQDLDDEMINTMIRLSHPDKHDGSVAATRATQALLQIRNRRRKPA